MEKPSLIKPALIGGVAMGLLYTIFSFIPVLNLTNCCCLWVMFGGALAAYIYIKDSSTAVTSGNGAAAGALAGFVGGIISSVFMIIMFVVQTGGDPQKVVDIMMSGAQGGNMPPEARQYIKVIAENFILLLIGIALFGIVQSVAMGAVGGIIGVAIFGKKKQPPPPPSYPNYGYPPSGPQPPPDAPPQPPPYPPADPSTDPGAGNPPSQ